MSLKTFCMVALLLIFACPSFAQETQSDANDDIKQIRTNLLPTYEMTAKSSTEMLPKADCEQVRDHFARYRDARHQVRLAEHWHKHGVQVKTNALVDGMDELLAERIRAQVSVQQAMVDGATYKDMFTKVRASFSALEDVYKNVDELGYYHFENAIFEVANSVRLIQATESILRENESIGEFIPELDGAMFDEDCTAFLTTLEELRGATYESNNYCKKWRRFIEKPDQKDAIDEKLGEMSLCYTADAVAARADAIDAFIANVEELEDDQKAALEELTVLNRRCALLGQAMTEMDELLVYNSKKSSGRLCKCYLKMNELCGAINLNLRVKLDLPEEVEVAKFEIDDEVAADDTSWEAPLKLMDEKLAGIAATLIEVPELSVIPFVASLNSEDSTVKAREKIKVEFTAMYQFLPRTWIGFVKRKAPHGLEGVNRNNVVGQKKYLFKKEKGLLEMKAPRTPGLYDLRMNDLYTGRELASYPVEVLPGDPVEKKEEAAKKEEKKKEKAATPAAEEKKAEEKKEDG